MKKLSRRILGWPRFAWRTVAEIEADGGSTSNKDVPESDPGDSEQSAPVKQDSTPSADKKESEEPLGEKGLSALKKERETTKDLKKENASLRESLAAQMKLAADAEARAKNAEAAKAAAELGVWRRDAATKHGLPDGMAQRLQGSTLEELEADAANLAEMLGAMPAKQHKILPTNLNQGKDTAGKGFADVMSGRELFRSKHSRNMKEEK